MKIAGNIDALAIQAGRLLEDARRIVDATRQDMGRGERTKFERLMKSHLEPVTNLALRLTGDFNAADDLVQETMLKAVKSWETFREQSSFKTWLFRITINTYRDSLRSRLTKQNQTQSLEDSPNADAIHSAPSGGAEELGELISKLIQQLPDRQRETLFEFANKNTSPMRKCACEWLPKTTTTRWRLRACRISFGNMAVLC